MIQDHRFFYEQHTWPEIKEIVKKQPVVILTIGSTEQHGHHLPLDTQPKILGKVLKAVVLTKKFNK